MEDTRTLADTLNLLTVQAVTRPRIEDGIQPSLFETAARPTSDIHWLNRVMNGILGTATVSDAVHKAAAAARRPGHGANREEGKAFETSVQKAIANRAASDAIRAELTVKGVSGLTIDVGPEDFIVTITRSDDTTWVCHTNIKWTATDGGTCDLCSKKRLMGVLYGEQARRDPDAIYRASVGAYELIGEYWVWVVLKDDLDDRYAFPVVHAAGGPVIRLNSTRPDTVEVVLDRHAVTDSPNLPAFQEALLDSKVRGVRDYLIRVLLASGRTMEQAVLLTYGVDVDALLTRFALLLNDADDEQVPAA